MSDKTWAKGWRVVLKCKECKWGVWCKNIGQTVKCRCDEPNYLTDNPNYYTDRGNKNNYTLQILKVEEAY